MSQDSGVPSEGYKNVFDAVVQAVGETADYVGNGLASYASAASETNPSGEVQVGGDIWADKLFFDSLSRLEAIGAYASEEREEVVDCGEGYSVSIDPLDGSSNLPSNNSVGTIVGVYDAELPASGRRMIASVMVHYGPSTIMTVAREDKETVQQYLLQDGYREPWGDVTVPDEPSVIGLTGRGGRSDALDTLVDRLESDLKLRYGGATVADLAQILEYGGLFGYPATTDQPDGKLRVLFESAPLAYLFEAAGARSSDGTQSLLDVDPGDPHARTPTFLGNAELIEQVESAMSE